MRWLEAYSSHRVGVGSVSAVCPRAGGISDRPPHEIIVVVVVVVLGVRLRCHHFTEARAPKWAKVIKLPRRDALAATPSLNNSPGLWPRACQDLT